MSQCDVSNGAMLRACVALSAIFLTLMALFAVGLGMAARIVSWILEF